MRCLLLAVVLAAARGQDCCGTGDGTTACSDVTFMSSTKTCCALGRTAGNCGRWLPGNCQVGSTGENCCCQQGDKTKPGCANACSPEAGCTGGPSKGCSEGTTPPSPAPCCPTLYNGGKCGQGTLMSGSTCCAGDLDSSANPCLGWQPGCDTSTGAGCCCDQAAMASKPFCQNACSPEAGCTGGPSKGCSGGPAPAPTMYSCKKESGQCVEDDDGKQSAGDCIASCKKETPAPTPPTPSPTPAPTPKPGSPTPPPSPPSPPPSPPSPPPPPAPTPASHSGTNSAVIGVGAVALIGMALLLVRRRRRGSASVGAGAKLDEPLLPLGDRSGGDGDSSASFPSTSRRAKFQSSRSINADLVAGGQGGFAIAYGTQHVRDATQNFAKENLLAKGAFGAVYKGVIKPHDMTVAIKVLTRFEEEAPGTEGTGSSEYTGAGSFVLEAKVLGKYRHPNIVGLLGHCLGPEQPEQYLVYEFMDGGSLRDRLRPDCTRAPPLTWTERFAIASDAARGLVYLHVDATPPIIHQDIKSENILLGMHEGKLVAKVADFGAVRIAPTLVTETHVSAPEVIGTKPYMPPEYVMVGHASEKTDTFAFGVVLLELITGKPPSDRVVSLHEGVKTEFLYSEMNDILLLQDAAERRAALEPLFDSRAPGAAPAGAHDLAAIAKHCLEMHVKQRCAVRQKIQQLDQLAGRETEARFDRHSGNVPSSQLESTSFVAPPQLEPTSFQQPPGTAQMDATSMHAPR